MLFSANGAASSGAWLGQALQGNDPSLGASAESAIHPGVASIPRITFVILDAVFSQEFALFVLKGAAAMAFLLGPPRIRGGRRAGSGSSKTRRSRVQ
jgi:hypothetical protein